MPFEITIPRLGWSMEEGTFVRWLKNDGDFVRTGEAVFELEGEKAAQDIEAVDSGILRIPTTAPQPGTVVAVGAVIGFLVAEGEQAPKLSSAGAPVPETKTTAQSNPVVTRPDRSEAPAAPPSVRRLAREMKIDLATFEQPGRCGRITVEDLRSASAKPQASVPSHQTEIARVASPRAKRVAQELGVDWRGLVGTGRDGRIRERDILQASSSPKGKIGSTKSQMSSRRKTIANRMKASRDRTVPVTLTTRIDATNMVNLRSQFKQVGSDVPAPSYSDIIVKLVSLVLLQHPALSIREEGTDWVSPGSADDIHIGIAVDTEDGLIVPVIQSAGSMSLVELADRTRVLINKSRTGKLSIAEMQGGVLTVTNLGAFGIDAFTPIINLPETAILGLGRIRRDAVVIDDQIVARDQMTLSLTFDHRIVDGAPAARFLQDVGQAIENPSAWLLRR